MSDVFVGILVVLGTIPAALLVRGILWCVIALRIRKWTKTSGIVIEINESDDKIVFEYEACNEKCMGSGKRTAADYKIGDTVALCYNPKKPNDYLVTQDWAPSKQGLISMCVGGAGIVLLVACYCFLEWIFRQ